MPAFRLQVGTEYVPNYLGNEDAELSSQGHSTIQKSQPLRRLDEVDHKSAGQQMLNTLSACLQTIPTYHMVSTEYCVRGSLRPSGPSRLQHQNHAA